MNIVKKTLKFAGYWLLITLAYILVSGLGFMGFKSALTENQSSLAAIMMLIPTFCYSAILAFIAVRSTWRGFRLFAALFWAFFGINGFLSQIESLVFLNQLVDVITLEFILRVTLISAAAAALFSLLTVLFYGPKSLTAAPPAPAMDLRMPVYEWAWKLALCAVVYVVIYLGFGALVAVPLGGEEFGKFYHGLRMPGWMLPFQMVRGLIWVSIAIPILALMRSPRWLAGLTVSLMFSIFIGIMLVLPNPVFPDQVRKAHLIELLTSNFLNGWMVVLILGIGKKA